MGAPSAALQQCRKRGARPPARYIDGTSDALTAPGWGALGVRSEPIPMRCAGVKPARTCNVRRGGVELWPLDSECDVRRLVFVGVPEEKTVKNRVQISFQTACHKIRKSTASCRSARGSSTTAVMSRPGAGS
jgi:hypothetical protein